MTTTPTSPAACGAPAAAAQVPATGTCCHRPMSRIEVTSRGATLALHTCASCGRHVWERDGKPADRAGLLDGVQAFLEQPRVTTRRRRRGA